MCVKRMEKCGMQYPVVDERGSCSDEKWMNETKRRIQLLGRDEWMGGMSQKNTVTLDWYSFKDIQYQGVKCSIVVAGEVSYC